MCLFVCFNVFKIGQNFKTYDFSVNILPYIQFSERFYDTPLNWETSYFEPNYNVGKTLW